MYTERGIEREVKNMDFRMVRMKYAMQPPRIAPTMKQFSQDTMKNALNG